MITKALSVGALLLSGAAQADCGAHVVCDAAHNDGNAFEYCESEGRDRIVSLTGHHQGVALAGPFSVAGDPVVGHSFKGDGFVGMQFPGWGYAGGRGPLLAGTRGNYAQNLAWIQAEHELAGESVPLDGVRVTVQLAMGCSITKSFVYEDCQLLRWD